MAAARNLPAQAHNRAADNIARTDYRRGPALLQPSATRSSLPRRSHFNPQGSGPNGPRAYTVSTHEPQSRLPAGSRAKRFRSEWSPTRRRGQTVAQRCSISVIPGIPMRGARISLLVTRIRIVARRRKGGRRAPHDTYRPSDRRAERAAPGSLAPDGSHRAGRRRPHAGRARSDWCRPRAPKNQPRRKQAARNNARSSVRHLSDLRSPSRNKVTPPS